MFNVDSSAIAAIGYNGSTLRVVFHRSGTYDHPRVPLRVFREFLDAESKGGYYAAHIRGRYR